jgi:23S rRNA pseudouridine2604 synthase
VKGLFPVGRLDKRSSGLIILTDDARITERLLNPKFDHDKEYRVTTKEPLQARFRERMERGVRIEGYMTKPCKVKITGDRSFTITLTEGKKHQIRRMCAALGVAVDSLERIRVMNIQLGKLKPGEHRAISGRELTEFLGALGL